jgi:hypothetical protein
VSPPAMLGREASRWWPCLSACTSRKFLSIIASSCCCCSSMLLTATSFAMVGGPSTASNFTTRQGSELEEALGAILALSAKKRQEKTVLQCYGSYIYLDGAVTSLLMMMQYYGSWCNHLVIKTVFSLKNSCTLKSQIEYGTLRTGTF